MINSTNVYSWISRMLRSYRDEHPDISNSDLALGLKLYVADALKACNKKLDPSFEGDNLSYFGYLIEILPDADVTPIRWSLKNDPD